MKRTTLLCVSGIFLVLTILSDSSVKYLQGHMPEFGGLGFLLAVLSLFVRDKVTN